MNGRHQPNFCYMSCSYGLVYLFSLQHLMRYPTSDFSVYTQLSL